jgi:hypothetical protein
MLSAAIQLVAATVEEPHRSSGVQEIRRNPGCPKQPVYLLVS